VQLGALNDLGGRYTSPTPSAVARQSREENHLTQVQLERWQLNHKPQLNRISFCSVFISFLFSLFIIINNIIISYSGG